MEIFSKLKDNITDKSDEDWYTYLPVLTSHTDTVWSKEPVISWSPVVLKPNEIISAEWP